MPHAHHDLVTRFYDAFARRDADAMAACYHPDVLFRDEVFRLHGARAGAMWRMLCAAGHDLHVVASGVRADEATGAPSGGVAVVTARTDGPWAEFSVSDDGPGIAPEYHARVFDLSQTLRPRDEAEGVGTGLSIVRKAVESRGGTIEVRSEGRGSTFTPTWPLHPDP